MKMIELNEAVIYLRELLGMSKPELIREARFKRQPQEKMKKTDILLAAFERKFDANAIDPTLTMVTHDRRHFGIEIKKQIRTGK